MLMIGFRNSSAKGWRNVPFAAKNWRPRAHSRPGGLRYVDTRSFDSTNPASAFSVIATCERDR